jgi:DAK2 domain fusion protein YloV
VILSQVMRGLVAKLRGVAGGAAGAPEFADALKSASVASYEAVLKPIEGTILTVVRETADAAVVAASRGENLVNMLRVARSAGREALANTPELLPVLKDAGVVDAGGAGFMLFIDSALHVVAGDALPEPEDVAGPSAEQLEAVSLRAGADGAVDVSELRYEVMFLLNLDDSQHRAFMTAWGEIGDSIVVVGGEGLYNCHIHTNDIGAAVEAPLIVGGRPSKIRITDLFEEMAEEHAKREESLGAPVGALDASHSAGRAGSRQAALPPVTCAVVAVASGEGLAELFGQMGVHGVVTGGQTMNPSTQELLDAVEHMNATQVVILPNNKNIIPVANQINELTKKDIRVVPTCSMPEALAALVAYDPEASAENNESQMSRAASSVATGEVTQAVRDTNSDAGQVKAGDFIGLVRGDGVVAVAKNLETVCHDLLSKLITPGRELLTIISGDGATSQSTESLVAHVTTVHPQITCEVHFGGQPLYPYLFGVE